MSTTRGMIVRVYVPFGIIRALVSDDPPRAASDSSSREMRTSRRRVPRAGVSFATGQRVCGLAGGARLLPAQTAETGERVRERVRERKRGEERGRVAG